MKDEIKKVLEMAKAGTINDEQATMLLNELMMKPTGSENAQPHEERVANEAKEQPRWRTEASERERQFCGPPWRRGRRHGFHDHHRGGPHHGRGRRGYSQGGGLGRVIHEALHNAFVGMNEFGPADMRGNSIVMSHCAPPRGAGFEFQGNAIHMAAVNDVLLEQSKMNGNKVDASKMEDMHLQNSQFNENHVSASSFEDFKMEGSQFVSTRIFASKVYDIRVVQGSAVTESEFDSSQIKDIQLAATQMTGTKIDASQVSDVSFAESSVVNSLFRAVHIHDVSMANCKFNDVEISGGDGWSFRKRGIFDAKFENCQLEKVTLHDCQFRDVVIKNVNVRDVSVSGISLHDQVIDGDEAFLAAIGMKK